MFPGAKTVRITDEQNQKQTQTKLSKDSVNQQFLRKQKERKKELEDIGTEPLVCDICGFTSMYSLVSHITRKHDVLMSDYRAKYPSTVVQRTAPSQTVKMIAALKKFYQDPENLKAHLLKRSFPSEVKHWTRKGFSEKEARIKISEHQTMLAMRMSNSPEARKKISIKSAGDNNPMSLVSIATRENISLEEASKRTPCYGRRGKLHPMFGTTHSPESLAKIAKNAGKHFSQKARAEMLIYGELVELGYDVKHNVGIKRYNCDIVFQDRPLILEYFGDFWHCNPIKWNGDDFHKRMKMPAKVRWAKDKEKIDYLVSIGFEVMVIWENDWNNSPKKVIQEIQDVANRIQR